MMRKNKAWENNHYGRAIVVHHVLMEKRAQILGIMGILGKIQRF